MAGALNHRFVSEVPDEGVEEEVGPDEWNDSLVVSGGSDGMAMLRRTSADDGWELAYLGAAVAFTSLTQGANVNTSETDLHSFSIPAGHFSVTKKAIRYKGYGSFAANGNTKTVKAKFGASGSVTLNPTTTAPNGERFEFEITIYRTGTDTQKAAVKMLLSSTGIELMSYVSFTETESGALTLKITGQSGTASSDILLDASTIEFLS